MKSTETGPCISANIYILCTKGARYHVSTTSRSEGLSQQQRMDLLLDPKRKNEYHRSGSKMEISVCGGVQHCGPEFAPYELCTVIPCPSDRPSHCSAPDFRCLATIFFLRGKSITVSLDAFLPFCPTASLGSLLSPGNGRSL